MSTGSYQSELVSQLSLGIRSLTEAFVKANPDCKLNPSQLNDAYNEIKLSLSASFTESFGDWKTQPEAKQTDSKQRTDSKREAKEHRENADDQKQPPKKKIRAYIDGCFDIMHSGHFNAIRQAKALTDVLVVGIHTNEEITKHKGPPVMSDEERRKTVEACKWVDEIAWGTPYDPSLTLLDELNCDFSIHGDDTSTTASGEDAYAEVKAAGRFRVIKRTEGVSTTDLVGRLLLMTRSHLTPALHPMSNPSSAHTSPVLGPVTSQTIDSLSLDALSLSTETTQPETKAPEAKSPTSTLRPSSTQSSRESKQQPPPPPPRQSEQRRGSGLDGKHYAAGISNFLPTTWRISAFSNNRTPKPNDVVVYIDGAFDLFHIGHIETLEKAKALGHFLYVGIHDDMTVNRHKGRNYPIMNLHERVLNVLSCKHVDEVVIGAPWVVTKDLITSFNIQIVAAGSNTKMDTQHEQMQTDPYDYPKQQGMFREIEISRQLTTQGVIERIIENRQRYEARNAKRSKKDLTYIANREYVPEI